MENSSDISSFPIDVPISDLDGYAEVNVYPFLDANDDGEFNYGTEMSLNYQIPTISGKKTVANLNIVKSKCPVDGHTKREETKNALSEQEKLDKGFKERIFGAIKRFDLEGWGNEETRAKKKEKQ